MRLIVYARVSTVCVEPSLAEAEKAYLAQLSNQTSHFSSFFQEKMSVVESVLKLIFHRQRRLSQPSPRLGPLLTTFKIRVKTTVVMVQVICMFCKEGVAAWGRAWLELCSWLELKSSKIYVSRSNAGIQAVMKSPVFHSSQRTGNTQQTVSTYLPYTA